MQMIIAIICIVGDNTSHYHYSVSIFRTIRLNLNRYLIAGTLSLTLHSAMLWSAPETHSFAMPAGSKSNSVSVNFMKAPAAAIAENTNKTSPTEKVEKLKPTLAPEPKVSAKPKPKPKPKPKVKPATKAKPHPVESNVKTSEPVVVEKQALTPQPKQVKPKPLAPKKITKPKPTAKQQASADAKAGVTDVPQLVSESRFAKTPQPPGYPRLAKRKGIEGTVVFEVWLDEQGQQIKVELKDSSGTKMLDKAAAKAIAQWQFLPHKVNGNAVAHRVYVPIKFKLD